MGAGAGLLIMNALPAVPRRQVSTQSKETPSSQKSHGVHVPVVTPDIGDLAYTLEGDVKVLHLVAYVLSQRIATDKAIDVWGFNGSAQGPTIEVNEEDRVRIIPQNHLPEPAKSVSDRRGTDLPDEGRTKEQASEIGREFR
jgi:FtsP/CotA-like multicopper oxidase with cupredoxin domain